VHTRQAVSGSREASFDGVYNQEALQDKTTWAIVNDAGDFWSNDDGWVDQDSKTLFYAHEKLTVNLPMGGKWALVG
jgi:hypothetical protein